MCGAVDGTLIKIDAPTENEADFVDRHGKHSINCMAVCGPDMQFYPIDAYIGQDLRMIVAFLETLSYLVILKIEEVLYQQELFLEIVHTL